MSSKKQYHENKNGCTIVAYFLAHRKLCAGISTHQLSLARIDAYHYSCFIIQFVHFRRFGGLFARHGVEIHFHESIFNSFIKQTTTAKQKEAASPLLFAVNVSKTFQHPYSHKHTLEFTSMMLRRRDEYFMLRLGSFFGVCQTN